MRDLRESRVDLVVMDRIPAINSMGTDLKMVGQGLIPQQFAMALRKGSTLYKILPDSTASLWLRPKR